MLCYRSLSVTFLPIWVRALVQNDGTVPNLNISTLQTYLIAYNAINGDAERSRT